MKALISALQECEARWCGSTFRLCRDAAVAHLLSVGPIFKGSDVAQVRVTVGTERFSFSKRSYTSASYKKLWYYV
jgi:hypothetical protein